MKDLDFGTIGRYRNGFRVTRGEGERLRFFDEQRNSGAMNAVLAARAPFSPRARTSAASFAVRIVRDGEGGTIIILDWRRQARQDMLFFLTGDIQVGKTRWLESAIGELAADGVAAYGVIAPGCWVEGPDGYEKMGIDNVLLPQGERIAFAKPRQTGVPVKPPSRISASSSHDGSGFTKPAWVFDQAAIDRVNGHFRELAVLRGDFRPGLLVVDELGWMELLDNGGLVDAVALVDAGAADAFQHALVVVRNALLGQALDRFAQADWGGVETLHADGPSREKLLAAFACPDDGRA